MPIDKIAIYWHIFLPFWQFFLGGALYIDANEALMSLVCDTTIR